MTEARADALEALVVERGLDVLIVGDLVRPGDSERDAMVNVRWLTGFTGLSDVAVVGRETRLFMTDFRYRERVGSEVDQSFEVVIAEQRMLADLAARLRGKVGFDDAATSVASFRTLEREMAAGAELVPATGLVDRLRRRKDSDELAAVQSAARIADAAFEDVIGSGLIARPEIAVARELEARIRELGAEPAFPAIVAAGPSGAEAHADPGDRPIEAGELVVIDWGARYEGYCSDCTRTVATGEVGEEEHEVYGLVRRAQERALEAVRPGVAGAEGDAVARSVIADAGRGEQFGHGLGHGVGLAIHEAPRLGQGSEDVLVEGDVLTVEPGVYVPGKFGVRIEDLVTIEAQGARVLSSHPKDLRVVD